MKLHIGRGNPADIRPTHSLCGRALNYNLLLNPYFRAAFKTEMNVAIRTGRLCRKCAVIMQRRVERSNSLAREVLGITGASS